MRRRSPLSPRLHRAAQALEALRPVPINLLVGDRRTSVRLDAVQLAALDRLAAVEGLDRHQVAGLVAAAGYGGESFSAALRSFLLAYWMTAAAEGEAPPKTTPEAPGAIS